MFLILHDPIPLMKLTNLNFVRKVNNTEILELIPFVKYIERINIYS